MIQIIRHRYVWFTLSGLLFVASIVALLTWGLKLGIDFTGGSIEEIHWNVTRPPNDQLVAVFVK